MKRFLFLSILFLSLSITDCFSQNNAINMESTITKEQMISRYGSPDSFNEYQGEFGIDRDYMYGETWIHTVDNYVMTVSIHDSRFLVMTDLFPGGIRVGDSYAKLCSSKYGAPIKASEESRYYYQLGDERVFFFIKKNVITGISFSSSL